MYLSKLSQKDKLIILIASTICMICFVGYTLAHLFYYNQAGHSGLNILSDGTLPYQIIYLKVSIYFIFISLLILLYYSIRKAHYNHKIHSKNKTFHVFAFIIFLFIIIYNPISFSYTFAHPHVATYVTFWNTIHFLGMIFILFFLFKTLNE
ncbi:MAG: hypothetical protein GY756_25130 [bacterium]|nr:hypothetical protein [bacterium]